MLQLEPGRPDSHLQPPTRDHIEAGPHVRQNRRVPVGDSSDQGADPNVLSLHGKRGERDPALELRAGWVGHDREEMVEGPGSVESDRVGRLPDVDQLLPGDVLGAGLDPEPHFSLHRAPRTSSG